MLKINKEVRSNWWHRLYVVSLAVIPLIAFLSDWFYLLSDHYYAQSSMGKHIPFIYSFLCAALAWVVVFLLYRIIIYVTYGTNGFGDAIELYHGTNMPLQELVAGSWLTQIKEHAICQAKKRAGERRGQPCLHIVRVREEEIRRPTEGDRNSENHQNRPEDEAWVFISKNPLSVVCSISGAELVALEKRLNSPDELLKKIS